MTLASRHLTGPPVRFTGHDTGRLEKNPHFSVVLTGSRVKRGGKGSAYHAGTSERRRVEHSSPLPPLLQHSITPLLHRSILAQSKAIRTNPKKRHRTTTRS